MIDARRVDFIAVPVEDLGRADAFYGETLGLWRNPNTSGERWVEYETGNLTLALSTFGGCIAFGVDDVEARRAKLEAAGVAFARESFDSGVCHGADFKDPVGNPLLLHHRYEPLEQWEPPAGDYERTDFIGVPVTDRPAGAEFYAETLGLRRNERSRATSGPSSSRGTLTILLNTPEQTGDSFRPATTRSRCGSRTWPQRWIGYAPPVSSSGSPRSTTPACATWRSSRTRTATR